MALSACHCQSKPCSGSRIYSIEQYNKPLFLGNGSTLTVEQVVSVKSARDLLIVSCIGEQVAGELPNRKLIEGQIIV